MRHLIRIKLLCVSLAAVGGCGNDAGKGPSPTEYAWPERFAYRIEFVSSTQRGGRELMRYQEARTLNFDIRDDESYLVYTDSIIRESSEAGGPFELMPPAESDTLGWYIRLGKLGEQRDVQVACDPAVDACRRTMPSLMPLQLRRIIPRLSEWPAPAGYGWVDTLEFDDASRGGTRGLLVTEYRVRADTTVGAAEFWRLSWHSVLRSYMPSANAVILESRPIEEDGVTFVDKGLLLPAFSAWAGATMLSRDTVGGALGTGFRGRAVLAGSAFDATAEAVP